MTSLRLRLEGLGWLAGWRLARALPERAVVSGFEALSMRSYRNNVARAALVRTNLAPVVAPERLEDTVRDAFRWYGRYWAETFRMPDIPWDEFLSRFSVSGAEHVDEPQAVGRGVVVATLHQGNWDAGGRWASSRWGLTVVVEVLRPRILFDRFVAHREKLGMRIIPLERGSDVTGRCVEEIQRGRVLALLADRDLTGRGIEVEMFGRKTKVARGPAVLALRTGAPLIPANILQRDGGRWHANVLPPIDTSSGDVAEISQRLADAYAGLIADAPAQWHMFSRYWLDA